MKTDVKVVFLIILVSSLLGITYNHFSPSGIPLIPEEKKLKWASDSLFNSAPEVSVETKDTSNINHEQIEKQSETAVKNEVKQELVKKEENIQTEPLTINLKQAYNLYNKNVLFIDAREPEDYRIAHIKNAINIPMDHFDDYEFMLGKIDKEEPIVTYCAGSDCDLSIVLGTALSDLGYKKIYVFFGGWNEWLEAKYPIEKSTVKNEEDIIE